MSRYQIRLGDWKVSAEIDDPANGQWRASLLDAPEMQEGDVSVVMLGPNGEPRSRSRARVVPGGSYQPTVLEGLEPFR